MSAGKTKRGPCPQCDRGARDSALATTTDERGTVSYCHRCGFTATENLRRAGHYIAPVRSGDPAKILQTWLRTLPLADTIGETYLRHRGCVIPPPDGHVRFLPARGTFPPSLCSLVTNIVTGKPQSLHFTRLAANGKGKAGTDRDKLLLAGYAKAGGVIRIYPDSDVTLGLGIAEGIETALAAAHVFAPVWAAIDAGNMAAFPVLPAIESLTVFADYDDAGLRAARSVARRWHAAGREIHVLRSATPGHDIADVVAA